MDRDPNQTFVPRWVILLMLIPLYVGIAALVGWQIQRISKWQNNRDRISALEARVAVLERRR